MAEGGPPAPKLPTVNKPMKTKATEQARIPDPPQQNPQPQLKPEVIVPPDQVPDPAPHNSQDPSTPAHMPHTVEPQNPPVHVPNQYSHKTLQCLYLTQYYHQLLQFRYHN